MRNIVNGAYFCMVGASLGVLVFMLHKGWEEIGNGLTVFLLVVTSGVAYAVAVKLRRFVLHVIGGNVSCAMLAGVFVTAYDLTGPAEIEILFKAFTAFQAFSSVMLVLITFMYPRYLRLCEQEATAMHKG